MTEHLPSIDAADATWSTATFTTQTAVIYGEPRISQLRRLLIRLHLARQPDLEVLAVIHDAIGDHHAEA